MTSYYAMCHDVTTGMLAKHRFGNSVPMGSNSPQTCPYYLPLTHLQVPPPPDSTAQEQSLRPRVSATQTAAPRERRHGFWPGPYHASTDKMGTRCTGPHQAEMPAQTTARTLHSDLRRRRHAGGGGGGRPSPTNQAVLFTSRVAAPLFVCEPPQARPRYSPGSQRVYSIIRCAARLSLACSAVGRPAAAMATPQMPRRPLGQTGLEVSVLGFGASPLGGVFQVCARRGRALPGCLMSGRSHHRIT